MAEQTTVTEPTTILTDTGAPKGSEAPVEGNKAPVEGDKVEVKPTSVLTGEPKGEVDAKPVEDKKGPAKPIEYKDFTLPDGFTPVEADMKQFKSIAAEAGLPQEVAQRFMDMHTKAISAAGEAAYDLWDKTQQGWAKEVETDKEIGGNNLAQVRATVAKALDQYGDKGTRDAIILTGAGNNPSLIRFMYRMSKALTEGGIIKGNAPNGSAQKNVAQMFYPDMKSSEVNQ